MNLQQLQQQRQEEARQTALESNWFPYDDPQKDDPFTELDTLTAASVIAGYLLALEEVTEIADDFGYKGASNEEYGVVKEIQILGYHQQEWAKEMIKELATLKAQAEALAGSSNN